MAQPDGTLWLAQALQYLSSKWKRRSPNLLKEATDAPVFEVDVNPADLAVFAYIQLGSLKGLCLAFKIFYIGSLWR